MNYKGKITTKKLELRENGKFDFLTACHQIKFDEL